MCTWCIRTHRERERERQSGFDQSGGCFPSKCLFLLSSLPGLISRLSLVLFSFFGVFGMGWGVDMISRKVLGAAALYKFACVGFFWAMCSISPAGPILDYNVRIRDWTS